MPEHLVGTSATRGNALEIRYSSTLDSVDDYLAPLPDDAGLIAPGFIDLQVNGFAGVDYNDPERSTEAIGASIGCMFSTGVTRFFPTVITGSPERMLQSIANLYRAKEELLRAGKPEGHAIAGIHVEGPHLSPDNGPRGAHPREQIRPPDQAEFERWQTASDGLVKLVTISPEWPDTPAYIRHLVRSGVVASIGHTAADRDQILAAVDAGATMSTHLGNASHPTLPVKQNYLWDQLAEDRLGASFIADGIHLPTPYFRAALRAKGLERAALVTDAVMPAMCKPGLYWLGQVAVELLPNGSVQLKEGGRLAGSALTMDVAIGNAVRLGRVTLTQALAMATVTPARLGRIPARQRGLTPGEKADLVRFSWDGEAEVLTVLETIVAGQIAYSHMALL